MKALIFLMALLLSDTVMAQQARLTRYEVKPSYREQFQKVLSGYVKQALADESNIMAEAYYEQEDPSVIWLIERWTGKINQAIMSVKPAKVYQLTDLEPLTKAQWRRTADQTDQPLTIMLFVDAKRGTEASFKKIYHQAMPQFRGEPGVVTYQLSVIEGDATQFVTYEKFRSEAAFQYHLKFPPIQPVIDYLNTSIKKPPFQQGLHHLIAIK
jgi:quinol monooxygenase YgiN